MRTLDEYPRRHAQRRPDKPAVIMGERVLTWGELDRNINRVAHALLDLGLQRGERVAVMLPNCPEYFELYFGISRAGLVAVPTSYRLTVPELVEILGLAEPTVLVASPGAAETVAALQEQLPSLTQAVFLATGHDEANAAPHVPGAVDYAALLGPASDEPMESPCEEGDTFAIFFTSGTTGLPKGAMVSHLNLEANGFNQFIADQSRPHDVNLVGTPLYHMGAVFMAITYIMMGCTQVVVERFAPKAWLENLQQHSTTVALLVPTMLNQILNFPEFGDYDLSSLRLVFYGGGPMPPAVLHRALATLPCGFTQGYGLTETLEASFLVASDHVLGGTEEQTVRLASAGREAVGADIKIVDDDGAELGTGEIGEIIISSRSNISGYFRNPEETAHAVRGRWFYTGDLGYLDKDRYLFVVDRKKDMVVSGGVNIYTKEIEAVIYTHPAVLEAAVIGLPDDEWGEIVTACVVVRDGASLGDTEIVELCRSNLAGYKKPRRVVFVDELPKNPSGKILKRELRTKLSD